MPDSEYTPEQPPVNYDYIGQGLAYAPPPASKHDTIGLLAESGQLGTPEGQGFVGSLNAAAQAGEQVQAGAEESFDPLAGHTQVAGPVMGPASPTDAAIASFVSGFESGAKSPGAAWGRALSERARYTSMGIAPPPALVAAEHALFAKTVPTASLLAPAYGMAKLVGLEAVAAKMMGQPPATPTSWAQVMAGMFPGLYGKQWSLASLFSGWSRPTASDWGEFGESTKFGGAELEAYGSPDFGSFGQTEGAADYGGYGYD